MAAISEEGMESLLRNFDQIYQEYKDGIAEIQLLKSRCNDEIKRREALEATCNSLKRDNERLMKMYTESLTKLANQLDNHAKCQSMKEELKRVNDEHAIKEDEHRNTMEILKQEHAMKIKDLERQFRCCQDVNEELQQDLAAHKNKIDILTNSLAQVNTDVELKYHHEIQDLKDWLMLEQEDKNDSNKKLQNAENELQICKMKQAEQQSESTSNRRVDTLKQKIMKLRKENEVLKRQLHGQAF
ncbi:4/1 protein short form protein isoform X1 [Tasmannia lanceolata]|uniref:4/1 protein short form protein isoform X1 n=1 Tax=Tasmannia lanceolata TaxID=3420 RepID=UPI0040643146